MATQENHTAYRQVQNDDLLHEPSVPDGDRRTAVLCHVFVAAGAVSGVLLIVPVVLWLTGRDRSPFIDDHGREAINFMISMILWTILLAVTIIGMALLWIPPLLTVILAIIAAVRASNRRYTRYPLTIRIL